MAGKSPVQKGRYLYAVVGGGEEKDYGPCGIDGGTVYRIPRGEMSAVVSDLAYARIRPERRHLAAHQDVLKRLMAESTPLPITFGVIVDGTAEIRRILMGNRKTFTEQLAHVAGRVEMGLRVSWDVPNIFEYFVTTDGEVRTARDRFYGTHREPSQADKIEVGRIFERALNERREEHRSRVEEILRDSCVELKNNPPKNESEVMNLACLIGRDAQAAFEKSVFAAAALFDNNYAFDYNGPWAPHNFVHIHLTV